MHVVASVQARLGSTRLPGKVMYSCDREPTLQGIVKRAEQLDSYHQYQPTGTYDRC
jgi:spore coat polysaccharide biosynthesis protein SpsF (cytidylyltransferase family)